MRAIAILPAVLLLAACEPTAPTNRDLQSRKAQEAARAIQFSDNAEIENIRARVTLTANPGLLGFVLLMNEAGQPIMYEGVKGKITSGGKRLTPTTERRCVPSYNSEGQRNGCDYASVPAPSDEGTHGSSGEYIFYWNQSGEYRQWNGKYLYADKPFRLRIEPLVITTADAAAR